MSGARWTYDEVKKVLDGEVVDRSKQAQYMVKWKYNLWKSDPLNDRIDESLRLVFNEYSNVYISKAQRIAGLSVQVTIDEAVETLKMAIVDFIDIEVKKLSEDRIKKLKDEYEVKLQDMQKVMIEAKNSSIIGMLKQKWGQL